MNIRSAYEMQDFMDKEHSWRIKEISTLKSEVRSSGHLKTETVIRASIPLLYAHWEGFIKNGSEAYLNYVTNQRLKYDELKPCFMIHGVKRRLNELTQSNQTKKNIDIIRFLMDETDTRATLSYRGIIDTESNLDSRVFENIASSIGIDTSQYETKYNFIDKSLLDRRNRIAHGEYLDVNQNDFLVLSDELLEILRQFKNDIENSTALDKYTK